MSFTIHIALDPLSRSYIARLQDAPVAAQHAVARAIDRENLLTVGAIQRTKLSRRGPRTLGVITNRLRGSMRASKTLIMPDGTLRSTIGSNVVYAGPHEFGFRGEVTVRSHSRRLYEALTHKTRAVMDPRTGRISKEKVTPKQTGVVQVRSHTRRVRIAERAFIRTTLEERGHHYTVAIGNAVTRILSNK